MVIEGGEKKRGREEERREREGERERKRSLSRVPDRRTDRQTYLALIPIQEKRKVKDTETPTDLPR